MLEIIQKEISDSIEELDLRREVSHAVATARKNEQASGIFSSGDQIIDQLRGIREMDVVVAGGMSDQELAPQAGGLIRG